MSTESITVKIKIVFPIKSLILLRVCRMKLLRMIERIHSMKGSA